MNPGTVVIGYVRVSTHEQASNGYGLDAQEAAIRNECDRRGWALLEVVRDKGASGKSTDRPGLQRALSLIASGQATGLVVSKLDRLSRSVVDFAMLLEWFRSSGATLVALDLGVDTSTPGGELVANVFAAVAQWERRTISQRTREGLAEARTQGKAISRPTVDPKVAKRIRRMRDRGMTLRAIAAKLNAEGVPTPRGGREWRVSSVQTACGYKRRPAAPAPAELPRVRRSRRS